MNNIKINTDQVTIMANNIKKQNEKMREEFDMADQAVKRLNDAWDGPAATNAIGKFNQMKTQICEQRYHKRKHCMYQSPCRQTAHHKSGCFCQE